MTIYLGKGVTVSSLLACKACDNLQVLYTWNLLQKWLLCVNLVGCSCSKRPLLAANPALCASALETSLVLSCSRNGESPPDISRREQSSVTESTGSTALEGCAGGDGRGEKEICPFLHIFYSLYFSLIFLTFFPYSFSPSYLFPSLSLLSSPLSRSSCNYLTFTASLTLWILLQPLTEPPHLLLCMLCFSSLHILPRSSDHL